MSDKFILLITEENNPDSDALKNILEQDYKVAITKNNLFTEDNLAKLNPVLIINFSNSIDEASHFELCHKVRHNKELMHIPFIFISEQFSPSDIIRSLESGASSYFITPFDRESLMERINYLIAESKLKQNGNYSEFGIDIILEGKKHFISAEKVQIIELLFNKLLKTSESTLNLRQANNALFFMHQELEKKNIELKKTNEQKNSLIRLTTHDLREPLSIIWRQSNVFFRSNVDKLTVKQKDSISVIKSYSKFMLDLVSDIQIFFNQLNLELVPTDLHSLIKKCIETNYYLAKEKNNQIIFINTKEVPLINIDPIRIEQVINNLLSNVIKYSVANNSIEISIKKEDCNIIISLKNKGEHIFIGDTGKLFQPFKKSAVDEDETKRSSGLSLAISKKIISAHGGKIWVENNNINEITFAFSLPFNGNSVN